MKQSSFYRNNDLYTPFVVIDGGENVVYCNTSFSVELSPYLSSEDILRLVSGSVSCAVTLGDKSYLVRVYRLTLSGSEYTVLTFVSELYSDIGRETAFSEYEPLLALLIRTAEKKPSAKSPCGLKPMFLSWHDSVMCEMNNVMSAKIADDVGSEIYVATRPQGFYVALTLLYKYLCLSRTISNIRVLLSCDRSFGQVSFICDSRSCREAHDRDISDISEMLHADRFIPDLLHEIGSASDFDITYSNKRGVFTAKVTLKRFKATEFSVFSLGRDVCGDLVHAVLREFF